MERTNSTARIVVVHEQNDFNGRMHYLVIVYQDRPDLEGPFKWECPLHTTKKTKAEADAAWKECVKDKGLRVRELVYRFRED